MSSAISMNRARWALLPLLLTVGATQGVIAQPYFCTPIRPGETAPQVARRITGEATGASESWFQIVDPATSRFVPKTRYGDVRAGWQACVATGLPAVAPGVTSNGNTSSGWARHVRTA